MRVVALVQARMGSARFPGKVLRPLAGEPILWHIVHRLKKCHTLDAIVIITTTNSLDDAIAHFAIQHKIALFRGPENNVLGRYLQAAQEYNADVIVRVTGDAPLIDAETLDRLVELLIASKADYAVGSPSEPNIHQGFEPVTKAILQRLMQEAGSDPVAREHVTAYFKHHPNFAKQVYLPIPKKHQFSGARISVDTPADLQFLEALYSRLGAPVGELGIAEVVGLLQKEPQWLNINNHVCQKSICQRNFQALIRCDGDESIGLGHIVRCQALADEMRDRQGIGIVFAIKQGKAGADWIRQHGFRVEMPNNTSLNAQEEAEWIQALINHYSPDVLVLDIRNGLSTEAIHQWKKKGIWIVSLDDSSERAQHCNRVFCPPVPQMTEKLTDRIASQPGNTYCGWEWVVLRRQFADFKSQKRQLYRTDKPKLLVSMGGSDPAGLTLRAIKILNQIKNSSFHVSVLLGPAFAFRTQLNELLSQVSKQFEILTPTEQMAELLAEYDCAFISFGITAYELAAVGVPSLILSLTEDHAQSAGLLVSSGAAISLGVHTEIEDHQIQAALESWMFNSPNLQIMSEKAQMLLDGKGAERIAAHIAALTLAMREEI